MAKLRAITEFQDGKISVSELRDALSEWYEESYVDRMVADAKRQQYEAAHDLYVDDEISSEEFEAMVDELLTDGDEFLESIDTSDDEESSDGVNLAHLARTTTQGVIFATLVLMTVSGILFFKMAIVPLLIVMWLVYFISLVR